jgi:hypothetical protein
VVTGKSQIRLDFQEIIDMAGYIILLVVVPCISVSFLGVDAAAIACNTTGSTCIDNTQCPPTSAFSCNDTTTLCSGFSAPDTTNNKVDQGCNSNLLFFVFFKYARF